MEKRLPRWKISKTWARRESAGRASRRRSWASSPAPGIAFNARSAGKTRRAAMSLSFAPHRCHLTPDLSKLRFPALGFSAGFATETLTPETAIRASAYLTPMSLLPRRYS